MTVLGIDASTSSTGWGVLKDGELLECGLIKPKSDDWRARIKEVTKQLEEIIDRYSIGVIVMEDVPMTTKNVSTLHKLSVLQGWIASMVDRRSIDLCLQSPTQWRTRLGMFDGTREGRKREVLKQLAIKMANEKFELELKKTHDDIAEGVLVGYSYFVNTKTINKKTSFGKVKEVT